MATERSAERRLVTCVFIDIAGSTDLTMRLGPDRMKRELDHAFGELRDVVQRHGGTVEKYIGDAVFALFGAPVAHADDPERAIRATAAAIAWASRQTALAVRIGVETGEALVDLAGVDAHQQMAVGAVVNTAARLQAQAQPGSALVGPGCREATAAVVEFADERDVELKGIGRISVARLIGVRVGAPLASLPFVGRRAEMEQLHAALARARAGRATFVLVTGPPGQGKTRLSEELVRQVSPGDAVLVARCRPGTEIGVATPLWQLVAADVGDVTIETLTRRIAVLFPDVAQRTEVLEVIAHTTGLATSERLLALPLSARRNAFHDAWRKYIAAVAGDGLLVVWVEDLHWAEPLFVGILDRATLRHDRQLLVLATARPEFLGSASLRPGDDLIHIELGPLDAEAAIELARTASATVTRTVERAEGNPLFIVELARARQVGSELPMTVQAAIAARIDELSPDDRALLQQTAIAGETFGVRDAVLLTEREPGDVAGGLARLAHARYLSPIGERYRFHHALVHDVAYGRLPVATRMRLHARYAREGADPGDVEALAYQWWEALRPPDAEWVWEDEKELDKMRAEALDAHLAAAARHADRLAHESALELLTRAQTLAKSPADIGRVHEGFGWAYTRQALGDDAWQHRLDALEAYRAAGGDPPASLYADMLAVPLMNVGFFQNAPTEERVGELLTEGRHVAGAQHDEAASLQLLAFRALYEGGAHFANEAFARARTFHDLTKLGEILRPIVIAQYLAGSVPEAQAAFRSLDDVQARGGFVNVGEILVWRVLTQVIAGDLAGAAALAEELDTFAARSTPHTKGHALGAWALVLASKGDWDAVREVARDVQRVVTTNPTLPFCLIPATATAVAAIGDCLEGRTVGPEVSALVERIVPKLPTQRAGILLLPRVMSGEKGFGPDVDKAYSDGLWWARNFMDPFKLDPPIALVMQRRWADLSAHLARMDRIDSPLASAVAAAIREEIAGARSGPSPTHAALRALGYDGVSELLRFRV